MTGSKTSESGISRRRLMKASAGIAAGVAAERTLAGQALAAGSSPAPAAARSPARILIKRATIISMDPKIGDIAQGDILIDGKKIVGVSAALNVSGAEAIDAANMIAIPGFVDSHRHSWQGNRVKEERDKAAKR